MPGVVAHRLETGSDWLASHPPGGAGLTCTLAGVARRVAAGEDFRHAVREFLDEFALRGDDPTREAAIEERPQPTGDRPRSCSYGDRLDTAARFFVEQIFDPEA